MNRFLRPLVLLAAVAVPAIALARPPLIYHRVANVVAHPNGTVEIRLPMHDVVIHVKAGDSVTVVSDIWAATGSRKARQSVIRRLAPEVSAQGNDVRIAAPSQHGWDIHLGWGSGPEARVTVTMPPTMGVNYDLGSGDFLFDNPGAPNAIQGISGSGDVHVHSASRELSAKTGSGDIRVALDGRAGSALLRTGSGDIDFAGNAATLHLATGSGDIGVHDATAGRATIHTGSGDIIMHWSEVKAGGRIGASTGSGDVVAYFPGNTVLGGSLSSGSGDIDSAFPVMVHGSHHSYTLVGGAGAVELNVGTGSGDVSLRKGG